MCTHQEVSKHLSTSKGRSTYLGIYVHKHLHKMWVCSCAGEYSVHIRGKEEVKSPRRQGTASSTSSRQQQLFLAERIIDLKCPFGSFKLPVHPCAGGASPRGRKSMDYTAHPPPLASPTPPWPQPVTTACFNWQLSYLHEGLSRYPWAVLHSRGSPNCDLGPCTALCTKILGCQSTREDTTKQTCF